MSLGDFLRLLRAKRGGITPWDIEAATSLPKGLYRQIEQRYRAIGDDDSIRILAEFYEVSYEDLRWRLDWPRKALSRALQAAQEQDEPVTLFSWDGSSLTGRVRWWDLGAVGLAPEAGGGGESGGAEIVVLQRHAIERWDPRGPEPAEGADEEENEEDEDYAIAE